MRPSHYRVDRDHWLKANGYVDEKGRPSYRAYTSSAHWARTRRGYYSRHARQCWVCGAEKGIILHHRTYETIGLEADVDLIALCHRCHALTHGPRFTLGDGCVDLRRIFLKDGEKRLEALYNGEIQRRKRIEQRRKARSQLRTRTRSTGRPNLPKAVRVLQAADMTPEERAKYGL